MMIALMEAHVHSINRCPGVPETAFRSTIDHIGRAVQERDSQGFVSLTARLVGDVSIVVDAAKGTK